MPNPCLIFPGTIIPGRDLLVMAIPTTEAIYESGNLEYSEGEQIIYQGGSWYVMEWNNAHNCFIAGGSPDMTIEQEQQALFLFCQLTWGDLPECGAPVGAIFQDYQPRLL